MNIVLPGAFTVPASTDHLRPLQHARQDQHKVTHRAAKYNSYRTIQQLDNKVLESVSDFSK